MSADDPARKEARKAFPSGKSIRVGSHSLAVGKGIPLAIARAGFVKGWHAATEREGAATMDIASMMTTEEVARLCRTSPETVRFWRYAGKGPRSFKVGRRVLYATQDVQAWIGAARDAGEAQDEQGGTP